MTSLYRIFVVLLIQGYVASGSKCGRCKFFTNLHDGHREAACTDVDKYTLCRNGELTETEVICGERKICNHKNYESPCQDAGSVEPDCPVKHNPDKTLQSCHLNSICKSPEKVPDLYDATCRRYLTCKMGSHGSLEGQIEQCPLGQQFDIRSENCVQEIQAGCPCTSKHCTCEGIMADPSSRFSFLTCVQIGRSPDFQVTKTLCPSGMYFDNTAKTCLSLNECVTNCPVISKICIKDGVLPHPKDRNAFITCKLVEGTSYFEETTTYCGEDEYFDGISLSCVNLNQCKTARKDQCPLLLDDCVAPGVKLADPTNWKHYISCNYIGIGAWIEGIRLSCKDDEFFSNTLQKCENLSKCIINRIEGCPHISSVCDKAGRKESSKKWNLYIECISIDKSIYFEEKEYSCGPDKFFDKKSESCLDLIECTDPNQNCPKVSKICTSEGNIPYPGDKFRYIICSKIEGTDLLEEKIVNCGIKKSFDIRRKICRDSATATIFIEKDKK